MYFSKGFEAYLRRRARLEICGRDRIWRFQFGPNNGDLSLETPVSLGRMGMVL